MAAPNLNAGLVSDCKALLTARDTLAGRATLNWSASIPITTWERVTVGESLRRVAILNLSGYGLAGTISPELGKLPNLRDLNLHSNNLIGVIPAELGSLTNLERLWLSENNLSGPIPTELGRLGSHSLVHWRLGGDNHRFTGCVPTRLAAIEDSDLASLELEVCEDS